MLPKVIIGILVVSGILFSIGFFVYDKDAVSPKAPQESTILTSRETRNCPDSLILSAPVDLDKATSILYPGQERGGHFKWHGGFRFDTSRSDEIEVRAPLDAVITDASRYIEQGRIQYMFDFESDCGYRYRFDHLVTLSPKFEDIAKNLPEPKVDDSRMTQVRKGIRVSAGEVIATAVGYEENVFVDFGVYDVRGGNRSENFQENAVCWLDMFSPSDSAKVKALPAGDSKGTLGTVCNR